MRDRVQHRQGPPIARDLDLHLIVMDLNALKLELIARILATTDESVLLAIERMLEEHASDQDRGPDHGTAIRSSEVGEGTQPYQARTYTRGEVQSILEEDRSQRGGMGDAGSSDDEVSELDRRRERHLKGESRSYTWEQAEAILRKDLER